MRTIKANTPVQILTDKLGVQVKSELITTGLTSSYNYTSTTIEDKVENHKMIVNHDNKVFYYTGRELDKYELKEYGVEENPEIVYNTYSEPLESQTLFQMGEITHNFDEDVQLTVSSVEDGGNKVKFENLDLNYILIPEFPEFTVSGVTYRTYEMEYNYASKFSIPTPVAVGNIGILDMAEINYIPVNTVGAVFVSGTSVQVDTAVLKLGDTEYDINGDYIEDKTYHYKRGKIASSTAVTSSEDFTVSGDTDWSGHTKFSNASGHTLYSDGKLVHTGDTLYFRKESDYNKQTVTAVQNEETGVNCKMSYSTTGSDWTEIEDALERQNVVNNIPRGEYLKFTKDVILTD